MDQPEDRRNPSRRTDRHYRQLAFAGIHLLSPSLFRLMDVPHWQGRPFSIIDFYLHVCPQALIAGCPIQATHWFDTGTPDTLARAEAWYETPETP